MTAVEEDAFVDTLVGMGAKVSGPCERHHATTILNALRLGVPAEAVLDFLPGISASNLLNAYQWLTGKVDAVNDAWTAVLDAAATGEQELTVEALTEVGEHLPAVPTSVAARAKASPTSAIDIQERLSQAINEVDAEMAAMHRAADDVESLLSHATDVLDADKGYEVGRALYHPYSPCLWSAGLYLPRRTGEVVPVMAARILDTRK